MNDSDRMDEFDPILKRALREHQEPERPEFTRTVMRQIDAEEIRKILAQERRRIYIESLAYLAIGAATSALLAWKPGVPDAIAVKTGEWIRTANSYLVNAENMPLIWMFAAIILAAAIYIFVDLWETEY